MPPSRLCLVPALRSVQDWAPGSRHMSQHNIVVPTDLTTPNFLGLWHHTLAQSIP